MIVGSFFNDHPVLFALVCSGVAVAAGIAYTAWLLSRPQGNERMREIQRAVQEGAAAYLRRQYLTIAGVSIVPFSASTTSSAGEAPLGSSSAQSCRRRPVSSA